MCRSLVPAGGAVTTISPVRGAEGSVGHAERSPAAPPPGTGRSTCRAALPGIAAPRSPGWRDTDSGGQRDPVAPSSHHVPAHLLGVDPCRPPRRTGLFLIIWTAPSTLSSALDPGAADHRVNNRHAGQDDRGPMSPHDEIVRRSQQDDLQKSVTGAERLEGDSSWRVKPAGTMRLQRLRAPRQCSLARLDPSSRHPYASTHAVRGASSFPRPVGSRPWSSLLALYPH